jgi:hypothetical protein
LLKERSTTGISSEGPPCSRTGDDGQREEISGGDPSGSGELDGGGVEALPIEEKEELLAKERKCLAHLFYSIVNK